MRSPPARGDPAARQGGEAPALAGWGDRRVAALPEVPTFRELGYPDAEFYIWAGVFAPKGTPEPCSRSSGTRCARPSRRRLQGGDGEVRDSDRVQAGAELSRFFEADAARLAEGVRKVGRIETK